MNPYKTIPNAAVIYCHILTLGKEGTAVHYSGIFITLASYKTIPNSVVIYCHSLILKKRVPL
jgi:hypothetical protein